MPDLLGHFHVVRFLDPDQFLFTAVVGQRIHPSFLPSRLRESGFVEELGATLAAVEEAIPDFRRYGIVRLTIGQLQGMGLSFALVPEGDPPLCDAHGEIGGVTKLNRPDILSRLELEYLERVPDRYQMVEVPCRNCLLKFDVKVERGYDVGRDDDGFLCECGNFVHTEGPAIEVS